MAEGNTAAKKESAGVGSAGKRWAFGLDIGGTTVKIGLFFLPAEGGQGSASPAAWELAEHRAIRTRTSERNDDPGMPILGDAAAAMGEMLAERSLDFSDVLGIGMGIPGAVIDQHTVNRCLNLGWGVVPAAEIMKRLTGVQRVLAENDANAAAYGEMWRGAGAGFRSAVMVTIGTGIGSGIIWNDRIIAGSHSAAGEIGHMKMNRGADVSDELEKMAAAPAILAKVQGILESGTAAEGYTDCLPTSLSAIPSAELTVKDIFDAAKEEDPLACRIVRETGDILGRALSYVSCVFDPEIFIIGGGVSQAGPILLESVEQGFVPRAFHASRRTRFRLAQLGNDAGIWGAVRLVTEKK